MVLRVLGSPLTRLFLPNEPCFSPSWDFVRDRVRVSLARSGGFSVDPTLLRRNEILRGK